jgi:hypothetical protein
MMELTLWQNSLFYDRINIMTEQSVLW